LNRYKNERFTEEECTFLDNFYFNVQEILHDRSLDIAVAFSVLNQFVMQHCYVGGRLNKGQIIANLQHRLSHSRNKNASMNFNSFDLEYFKIPYGNVTCCNEDAVSFINQKNFDLVYIDPPYGGSQSDYGSMYKFFEEYIDRKPYEEIEYLQKVSKKFSGNKSYGESFKSLLKCLPADALWVFSFNNSSWAKIDFIESSIREFKKDVETKEIEYNYKYRDQDNTVGLEYVIIAK
jgi:site-specific DNA-adenine methylase